MPNQTLIDETATGEGETPSSEAMRRLWPTLQWAGVGFGVGCLWGALIVAGYTLFGATRLPDCTADACGTASDLAMRLGWAVMFVAVVVLAAFFVHRWLPEPMRWGVPVVAAVGGLGVIIGYHKSHFTESRNEIDTYFRTWEQMWTITAAVWLVAIGAGVVAVITVWGLRAPGWLGAGAATVGLVVAIVLSNTLGADAVHRGDDTQYVDATTGADGPVAPKPAELGQRRFQLALPNRDVPTVLPAGAGFVVEKASSDDSDAPEVVAYDAAGRERWHYQRTGPGPMNVNGVGVYGDGSVVVVSLFGENGLFLGLDAVTGARLWTSTDGAMRGAVDVSPGDYRSPQFVVRDDGHWTAFDPRTGQRIWSIEDPAVCPSGTPADGRLPNLYDERVYPVDTPTTIGSVIDCSTRDRVDLRLVTVNPASGAVTLDKTLTALEGLSRDDIMSWMADPVPGARAVIVRLFSRAQPMDAYVDYQTDLRTDYPGPNPVSAVGDGMFALRDGQTLRLFSGEAVPQCDIPLGPGNDVDYAFLRDQVVVLDDQARKLRVFDRAGCGEVGTAPIPPGFGNIEPMRGVTVLTRRTGTPTDAQTTLLGFAPA